MWNKWKTPPQPLCRISSELPSIAQALLDAVDAVNGGRRQASSHRSGGAGPGIGGEDEGSAEGSQAESADGRARQSTDGKAEVSS